MKIELSARAQGDIRSIAAYTRKTFSLNQADRYIDALYQMIKKIADQPGLGHVRPDMPMTCKAISCNRHVIVYTIRNNTLYVVRVLHDQFDFKKHDL